jgi:capsular exopolysaccharide synthesis family protein
VEGHIDTLAQSPVTTESPRDLLVRTAREVSAFWWLFLLLPAVGGLIGYLPERSETPMYKARAELLLVFAPNDPLLGVTNRSLNYQLASIYRQQVRTITFLRTVVASNPDLSRSDGQIRTALKVRILREPTMIRLEMADTDPQTAANIVNAVARGFVKFTTNSNVQELANMRSSATEIGLDEFDQFIVENLQTLTTLQLLEPVVIPEALEPSKRRRSIALGIVAGLFVAGILFVALRESIGGISEGVNLQERFGLVSLGKLPKWSEDEVKGHEIISLTRPSSQYSEAFRSIRANLHFASARSSARSVLVTSPRPSDGKSTIASNLAVVMAQAGKRTVLIDCDLRRPTVRRHFGLSADSDGLTNFLADHSLNTPDAILHNVDVEGLEIIPSGPIPPNPAELLDSPRMRRLVELLLTDHDMVLLDSPPILILSDSAVLASKVDGTVLVLDGSGTSAREVNAAIEQLHKTGARVLGAIVTKMKVPNIPFMRRYHYDYAEDVSGGGDS